MTSPEELLQRARSKSLTDLVAATQGSELDPLRFALAEAVLRGGDDRELVARVEPIANAIKARSAPAQAGFQRIGAAEIFAPLPPTRWLCRELQWCPGRPSMLLGYGFSGKTLAAQSAALSIAADKSIWGWFRPARPGKVLHIDHEQGAHATRKRYQRLAIGLGIEPALLAERLEVVVFPDVYLNSDNAFDVYVRECEGVDLCILDALRGATPGLDENDSKIRACLDLLARVSEKTGTTFLVLHHAGKGSGQGRGGAEMDLRMVGRGSSAIFDACGSTLLFEGEKGEGAGMRPKRVSLTKGAAEAEGGTLEPFYLAIEDVEANGNPRAGVRVVYKTLEQVNPPTHAGALLDSLQSKIVAYVREENAKGRGVNGKGVIAERVGGNRQRVFAAVGELEQRGVIVNRPERIGGRLVPRYWLAEMAPVESGKEGAAHGQD